MFLFSPLSGGVSSDHCWLVEGSRQKNYRPLLERPCCESLESRINHFVKRGRLEREEGENGGEAVHRGKRSKHSHNSLSLPVSAETSSSEQSTNQKAEDWYFPTGENGLDKVNFVVIFCSLFLHFISGNKRIDLSLFQDNSVFSFSIQANVCFALD